MIGLLLKGIFREISGFNEEILIYLLESFVFGVFFDNIQICIQFYNLQQQLFFLWFFISSDQKSYILHVYVTKNNVFRTLAQFFYY